MDTVMNTKNKIHYKKIEELFGFTRQTWAKWQKENRPIVKLLNYFDDEDIDQLLNNGKVIKMEQIQAVENLKLLVHEIHNVILQKLSYKVDKYNLDTFLPKIIDEYNNVYTKYPTDVVEEFIEFILKYDLSLYLDSLENSECNVVELQSSLLEIISFVSKEIFYLYVENINLLDNKKFDIKYLEHSVF